MVTGSGKAVHSDSVPGGGNSPKKLSEIDSRTENRISLNNAEVDRFLGGASWKGRWS